MSAILESLRKSRPPVDIIDLDKPKPVGKRTQIDLDELDKMSDNLPVDRNHIVTRLWFLMGILYGQGRSQEYMWFYRRITPTITDGTVKQYTGYLERMTANQSGPIVIVKKHGLSALVWAPLIVIATSLPLLALAILGYIGSRH